MILIVDDDTATRVLATKQLEALGFRSETAKDGDEAILKAQIRRYEAILMDVHMPRMDGFEATRTIKDKELEQSAPHVPIIALTANPDRDLCLKSGMDDYLFKPVTLGQLQYVLTKWIPSTETTASTVVETPKLSII